MFRTFEIAAPQGNGSKVAHGLRFSGEVANLRQDRAALVPVALGVVQPALVVADRRLIAQGHGTTAPVTNLMRQLGCLPVAGDGLSVVAALMGHGAEPDQRKAFIVPVSQLGGERAGLLEIRLRRVQIMEILGEVTRAHERVRAIR